MRSEKAPASALANLKLGTAKCNPKSGLLALHAHSPEAFLQLAAGPPVHAACKFLLQG